MLEVMAGGIEQHKEVIEKLEDAPIKRNDIIASQLERIAVLEREKSVLKTVARKLTALLDNRTEVAQQEKDGRNGLLQRFVDLVTELRGTIERERTART